MSKEIWLYDNDSGSYVGGPFVVEGLSLAWIDEALQDAGLWAYALETPPDDDVERITDDLFNEAIDAKIASDAAKKAKSMEKRRKLYEQLKAEFETE